MLSPAVLLSGFPGISRNCFSVPFLINNSKGTYNNGSSSNNNRVLTVDNHVVALIVRCIRIELEFGKCWLLRRGENRSTRRKTSRSREENQQQTQPTYGAETGNRTRATYIGGWRVLSPLRHPCSPATSATSVTYGLFLSPNLCIWTVSLIL